LTVDLKRIQVPCQASTSALSTHCKILIEQLVDIQKKDHSLVLKANDKSQQSGEQSSEIIVGDEELISQKVGKMVQSRLQDNQEWA